MSTFLLASWLSAPHAPATAFEPDHSRTASRVAAVAADVDRSPVDVELSPDGRWLLTANQTSHSVSVLELPAGRVVQEIAVGRRPISVAVSPDGKLAAVACGDAGEVHFLELSNGRLQPAGVVFTNFDPHGVKFHPDGRTAYVALTGGAQVAEIDVARREITARIDVGRWPRYLDVSPDGSRLAVGVSGERAIAVVDLKTKQLQHQEECSAINIGHLQVTADNQYVYFPWMIYRHNPIDVRNIRLGWVLASRIARVKMGGPSRREAISLDVPGEAMSDPFGLRMTRDEQKLVVSSSGTHELLVYRLPDLPLKSVGGPGDLIDPALRRDPDRFHRIPVGGRPMGLRIGADDRTVYVANYIENAVQVVDLGERRLVASFPLGGAAEASLARQGEALFFDARLSLDQWYSCHSCHYDGGSNTDPIDTHNDGSVRTFKTVLPLYNVHETGPWTWHGWQQSLEDSIRNSVKTTMIGPEITDAQTAAIAEYLKTLAPPPNPHRQPDGSLTPAAERGRQVFFASKAGCSNCHSGPHFTDNEIHDVGLSSSSDAYAGFNTPSLIAVYRKTRWLHNGRARSLEAVLTEYHDPAKVTGQGELTDQERSDLLEYLKSL